MLRLLLGLLLPLLLVVVRRLARLVTGLLDPSMVHFTVEHRSDTLPTDHAWICLMSGSIWKVIHYSSKYNRGAHVNVYV